MAGSGPGASIGGGWASGPGNTFDKHRQRRDKFLATHPEFSIVHIRMTDHYEASSGDSDSAELVILTDKHLGSLMDRLETRFPEGDESKENTD
jgi:hypothetical protein